MDGLHRLFDDGADLPCTLPEDLLNLVGVTLQIRPCGSCIGEILKKGLKKFLLGVQSEYKITEECSVNASLSLIHNGGC